MVDCTDRRARDVQPTCGMRKPGSQQHNVTLVTVDRCCRGSRNEIMGQAAVTAWNTKYTDNAWRPITVIQNADSFANAGIVQDQNWQPLIITPRSPNNISRHSISARRRLTFVEFLRLELRVQLHHTIPARFERQHIGGAGDKREPRLRRHSFRVLEPRRSYRRTAADPLAVLSKI